MEWAGYWLAGHLLVAVGLVLSVTGVVCLWTAAYLWRATRWRCVEWDVVRFGVGCVALAACLEWAMWLVK